MNKIGISLLSALTWLGSLTSAQAEASDWNYSASIYLFAAETKTSTGTPFGTVSAELSFSDALESQ